MVRSKSLRQISIKHLLSNRHHADYPERSIAENFLRFERLTASSSLLDFSPVFQIFILIHLPYPVSISLLEGKQSLSSSQFFRCAIATATSPFISRCYHNGSAQTLKRRLLCLALRALHRGRRHLLHPIPHLDLPPYLENLQDAGMVLLGLYCRLSLCVPILLPTPSLPIPSSVFSPILILFSTSPSH